MLEVAGLRCRSGGRTDVTVPVGTREDGSSLELRLMVLNGGPGPIVLLVALQHGTELIGAEIIRRLVEDLDPADLTGAVIAVPVANPLAYLAHLQSTPRDGANLNRIYPGDPRGSISQRIASTIYSTCLDRADAVIDFHSNSYPAVHWVIAKDDETDVSGRSLAMARAFGLTIGRYPRRTERQLVGTLVDAAMEQSKPGILVELTAHTMLIPDSVVVGVRGTKNVLKALGVLSGPLEVQTLAAGLPRVFTTNHRLRANFGGIVHHIKHPGEPVKHDEVIARVITPMGSVAEEVRSPCDGFVLSYPRFGNQAVMTGDHVAFVAGGVEDMTIGGSP